jgi:hypothetical protein
MTQPTLKRGAHSVASHPPLKLLPQTHKRKPASPVQGDAGLKGISNEIYSK